MSVKKSLKNTDSLWILTVGPGLWAVHFLFCYGLAAVYCAKAAGDGDIAAIRWLIVLLTLVVLGGIAAAGLYGLRRQGGDDLRTLHPQDTPEDRYRFLGFATLLLAGISFVATCYVAMVVFFFETCR